MRLRFGLPIGAILLGLGMIVAARAETNVASPGLTAVTMSAPPPFVASVSTSNGSAAITVGANPAAYTSTTDQTIASTSDVSCLGSPPTIPANSLYVGNKFRLTCRGYYSTPLANTATLTAKVKFGAATIVSTTSAALPISASKFDFAVDEHCTVRSIGSSGSMVCNGGMTFATALSNLAALYLPLTTTGGAVTINTTVASVLDMTGAWSSVAGGQTADSQEGGIEVLN